MSEKVIRLTPDMVVSMMRADIGERLPELGKMDNLRLVWRVESLFGMPVGWERAFLNRCALEAFKAEGMTADAEGWFRRAPDAARAAAELKDILEAIKAAGPAPKGKPGENRRLIWDGDRNDLVDRLCAVRLTGTREEKNLLLRIGAHRGWCGIVASVERARVARVRHALASGGAA
jgi:hypothetical protein